MADWVVTKREGDSDDDAGGFTVEPAGPGEPGMGVGPDGVVRQRPRAMFAFGGNRGQADRSKYNNPPSGKQVNWAKTTKSSTPRSIAFTSLFPSCARCVR